MFELSEYATLARQMNGALTGKVVREGNFGNSPHKFVWHNVTAEEFALKTRDKTVGAAYSRGRWLFLPLEPGYVAVFGECGGRILYHASADDIPSKYHFLLKFSDGSALSAMTQMWGAMELYERGEELKRLYIRDMRPTPVDEGFTFDYFSGLIDECNKAEKRSVKGLLTQDQLIPGLGNSIAQDIMFNSGLHPRHALADLDRGERKRLYDAVVAVVNAVTKMGGRNDECDLFGQSGGYRRILSKEAMKTGCRNCGSPIEKIQYLGGSSYFCPRCQS